MIDIDKIYVADDEIRKNKKPYFAYYSAISNLFNMEEIKSFIDLGGATGHLSYYIHKNHNIDVTSVEYFSYHKDSPECLIKDYFVIADLRKPLNIDRKYDLVNCSEVIEHIEPEYQQQIIENIKSVAGKYVIITWPDGKINHQHFNPKSLDDYKEIISNAGFSIQQSMTDSFVKLLQEYKNAYPWWKNSATIWEIDKDI